MSHISLRVTDEERTTMENYAKLQGVSLSEIVKSVFFQHIEDELDLQKIREHRDKKARGEVKMYTHDEIVEELGFD